MLREKVDREKNCDMFCKGPASTLICVTSSIKGEVSCKDIQGRSRQVWELYCELTRDTKLQIWSGGFWCHPGTFPWKATCYCALKQGINTPNCSTRVPQQTAVQERSFIWVFKHAAQDSQMNVSKLHMLPFFEAGVVKRTNLREGLHAWRDTEGPAE